MDSMELKVLKKVEGEKYEVILYDNNLFYVRYLHNKFIEEVDILEIFKILDSFNLPSNVKRLIHLEEDSMISKGVRDQVQDNLRPTLAEAFLFTTLPQKIIFKAYTKFRKNEHPIAAFNTFEEAVEWLESFD